MKRLKKCGLALCLSFLLAAICLPAVAADSTELKNLTYTSASYILSTVSSPEIGSTGGEWAVIGLARSGYQVPQSYWDNYYAKVCAELKAQDGVLDARKYTEYARVVLALTAIGADPTDVAGYDLTLPLADFEAVLNQGINGAVWALIALDSGDYAIPEHPTAQTQASRQLYLDEILKRQLTDGGWNLTAQGGDGESDPDVTGMVLQALANYQDQAKVRAAIEAALACLSEQQDDQGGFSAWNNNNSESVAQVIVALCSLGVDLSDERFVKNGNTLLDNLLSFRQADGSFVHTSAGSDNLMASEQGLYALVAAMRAENGQSALYDMNDVTIRVYPNQNDDFGLPGKDPAVGLMPVTKPDTSFPDIKGHANQAAIEALAVREIITGKDNGLYEPDADMTRAEFATIIVKALGLTPKTTDVFGDFKNTAWFAPYVGTAYEYGIVKGTGGTDFSPYATISRQEAAVMVSRAAALCGIENDLNETAVLNILAAFSDYVQAADWAKADLALCYSQEILNPSDPTIEPKRAILRSEIAQMVYNLLIRSALID